MARNKHPEETVKRILDVAMKLFLEQGYDNTTLADIIRATGFSKGAIYHHFASKAEILIRICDRIGEENAAQLAMIRENRKLNGQQKLREVFRASLLTDNPQFLSVEMKSIFEEAVPDYIAPIVREGIEDGSIVAEHPKETAEALVTLSDLWLNPIVMPTTPEEARAKCHVYNQIAAGFGMEPLLDEELIEALAGCAQKKLERLE